MSPCSGKQVVISYFSILEDWFLSKKFEDWLYSKNTKQIGTLFLIYALFAGLVSTVLSVLVLLEVLNNGMQIIIDNQLYNNIITAHTIIILIISAIAVSVLGLLLAARNPRAKKNNLI